MNDTRRRFVRLSIFMMPAIVPLAGIHVFRGDLRDAAASMQKPGYALYGNTFVMSRNRAESLGPWTRDFIAYLRDNNRIYGFKAPDSGFRIEIRTSPGTSEAIPGSNRIILRGVTEDAPLGGIQEDLSRLVSKALLRTGAPDADFSPWFEEGVSLYYKGNQRPYGSRKAELIREIRMRRAPSLADALQVKKDSPYFGAISHSLVAFLEDAYLDDVISTYAEIECQPGPVPPGEFQRIFGPTAEQNWHDFIERNGS